MFSALLLSVSLAASAPTAPLPSLPIAEPEEKWVVDFGQGYCAALHRYRVGEASLTFGVIPSPTGDGAELFVEAPRRLKTIALGNGRVLLGDQQIEKPRISVWSLKKSGYVRYTIPMEQEDYLNLQQSDRVTIDTPHLKGVFPIPKFGEALKVLDQCKADLLEYWGLSRQSQAVFASFPKSERSTIFIPEDYPDAALRKGETGRVRAVLDVDASGKVTRCRITEPSGNDELERVTCSILLGRAKYKPALDKDGQPMAAVDFATIDWAIR